MDVFFIGIKSENRERQTSVRAVGKFSIKFQFIYIEENTVIVDFYELSVSLMHKYNNPMQFDRSVQTKRKAVWLAVVNPRVDRCLVAKEAFFFGTGS